MLEINVLSEALESISVAVLHTLPRLSLPGKCLHLPSSL